MNLYTIRHMINSLEKELGRFPMHPTHPTRDVFTQANSEGNILVHNFIGTEHLLLGILQVPWGREFFDTLQIQGYTSGINIKRVRSIIEFTIGKGDSKHMTADKSFTPRASQVIRLAIREAQQEKRPEYDTANLLDGIVRESTGIACMTLENLGIPLYVVTQPTELARLRALEQQHNS